MQYSFTSLAQGKTPNARRFHGMTAASNAVYLFGGQLLSALCKYSYISKLTTIASITGRDNEKQYRDMICLEVGPKPLADLCCLIVNSHRQLYEGLLASLPLVLQQRVYSSSEEHEKEEQESEEDEEEEEEEEEESQDEDMSLDEDEESDGSAQEETIWSLHCGWRGCQYEALLPLYHQQCKFVQDCRYSKWIGNSFLKKKKKTINIFDFVFLLSSFMKWHSFLIECIPKCCCNTPSNPFQTCCTSF